MKNIKELVLETLGLKRALVRKDAELRKANADVEYCNGIIELQDDENKELKKALSKVKEENAKLKSRPNASGSTHAVAYYDLVKMLGAANLVVKGGKIVHKHVSSGTKFDSYGDINDEREPRAPFC